MIILKIKKILSYTLLEKSTKKMLHFLLQNQIPQAFSAFFASFSFYNEYPQLCFVLSQNIVRQGMDDDIYKMGGQKSVSDLRIFFFHDFIF